MIILSFYLFRLIFYGGDAGDDTAVPQG